MPRDDAVLPETVRADIEWAVAEALNLCDLRRGVEALAPRRGMVTPDHDEIDLTVMWVWLNCSARWPAPLRDDDGMRPCIDGYILATVQAHDLYRGRRPTERVLEAHQRRWLEAWEARSREQHRRGGRR
jgi:hypothetical protein